MGPVPGAQPGQRGLDVGLDRLFAEVELASRDRGRFAVGEQLQDLALAAGQLPRLPFGGTAGVDEALLGGGGVDRAAQLSAPAVRET